MLWGRCQPASPGATSACKSQSLETSGSCAPKYGIVLRNLFIYLFIYWSFYQVSLCWHSGLQDDLMCQVLLRCPEA